MYVVLQHTPGGETFVFDVTRSRAAAIAIASSVAADEQTKWAEVQSDRGAVVWESN